MASRERANICAANIRERDVTVASRERANICAADIRERDVTVASRERAICELVYLCVWVWGLGYEVAADYNKVRGCVTTTCQSTIPGIWQNVVHDFTPSPNPFP